MEIYLRAMVKQFDDTQCYASKCDWAMHNYLVYYGLLQNIPGIKSIKQTRSSQGAVNNVGRVAPLQDKPVWMEDGTIWNTQNMQHKKDPSWAVHQYDQDKILNELMQKEAKQMISKLNETYASQRTPASLITPTWGEHRPDRNAIFVIMNECKLEMFVLLVKSVLKFEFEGDIVISVSSHDEMSSGVWDFLQYHIRAYKASGAETINLVVYEGVVNATEDDYLVALTALYSNFTDTRPSRSIDVARLEVSLFYNLSSHLVLTALLIFNLMQLFLSQLFWYWSKAYTVSSEILTIDLTDAFFQKNLFTNNCTNR